MAADPVELRVLTSPDDLELYRLMAERYEQHTAEDNHGCRTTNVSVYATDPARAIDGVASAWSAEYLRDHGQRTDLLVVNSADEVASLRELVRPMLLGGALPPYYEDQPQRALAGR
ncbi:hypothetical protein ACTG9Q_19845 [Actinokineospora sp. 24-640]